MDQPGNTSTSNIVVPIVCRPDYRIGLEVVDGGAVFGHVSVTGPTTPGLMRRLRKDADTVMGLLNCPVFAMTLEVSPAAIAKHAKFVAHLGFQPHGVIECRDGTSRPVHIRRS